MKYKFLTAVIVSSLATAMLVSSCGKSRGNDPGTEYMPDMYVSEAYEPLTQPEEQPNTINPYGMNMRVAPANTIARNQLSYYYPFEKTPEGYEAAKKELRMPANIERSAKTLTKGKHLYDINCSPCHGDLGLADGAVAAKLPSIPSYATDRIQNLEVGGMYHTITYGLNLMGSYASVLTPEERWYVIQYVELLRTKAKPGATEAAPADTTKKTN